MPPACFASPACGTLNGRLRSLGASRCVAGSGRRVARSGDPRRGRPRTAVPLTAQFSGDEGVTDDDAGVSDDWLEKALSEMPAAPRPSFVEEDQFTEFERRDRAALRREKEGLACVDLVDAHRYVMIADESQTTFERAARRHGGLLVQSGAECGRRFVIAKGIADPTFGYNRGVAPYPPRYCCFESFVTREQGWDGIDATTRWLAAVDRVMPGHPLAPVKSHVAMYARRHEGQAPGPVGGATDVSEWIIATEVLNAKYTGPAMEEVRRRLIEHADASLARGQVLAFDVLQSVESPTCFKTWELYPSMSAFQEHMSAVDAAFAESVLPWRAAVNRVRQIYAPLVCLFADA